MESGERRSLDLDGARLEFTLRRSSRAKWLRADVGLRTGLRVTLPAGGDESQIEPFLRSRRRWLLRVLRRFERLAKVVPDRTLEHGAKLPLLGRDLTLDLCLGEPKAGRLGDALIVHVRRRTGRSIRAALQAWYMDEARRHLPSRAHAIASRHGLAFKRIVVGDQKSRWGTCYANGTISLNWRLMLAPTEVADYLVCHELAHIVHPNHSKAYWSKVAELCPAYREHERWLRQFGPGLVL